MQENNHHNKLYISETAIIQCIISTQSASIFMASIDLKLVKGMQGSSKKFIINRKKLNFALLFKLKKARLYRSNKAKEASR